MRRCGRQLRLVFLLAPVVLSAATCRQTPQVREYTLAGQIVAIDRATNYVTVQHGDIKGFMPGMTMAFAVKDPSLLEGRAPGDLITATLLVQNTDAWISGLTKTGSAPLPAASTRPVPGLAPGDRVSDQTFVDQHDTPVTMGWVDGHVAVLTFIYTRCPLPDFCPAIDRRFVELQDAIKGASGSLTDVRLLSISVDPSFDRPAVLEAHSRKLGADPAVWRFVTAPQAEMAIFGRQFGLDVRQTGTAPADIEHNLRTVVLDRDRRVVEVRTGTGWIGADLVARLRTVTGA